MSLLYHLTHFLSLTLKNIPFPEPTLADVAAGAADLCRVPWTRVLAEFDGTLEFTTRGVEFTTRAGESTTKGRIIPLPRALDPGAR
eukprot:807369-Prorocentrum_minimum.AAC.1